MIHTPKHTKYLRTSWSMRSSQLRLSNVLNRLRETMHSFREREENATLVTMLHIPIANSTDKTVSFPSIHAPHI